MSEETEVTEEEKFASVAAIEFAEENGLTAAKIEALGVEGTGSDGKFTKDDVRKAVEVQGDDSDETEDDDDSEEDGTDESAEEAEETEEKPDGPVYTYVGGGEDSPRVINFMGRQKFVRGKATVITDDTVLAKVKNNPTFVQGEVDQEELHDYDEKARKEANDQRQEDQRVNDAYMKRHG